MTLHPKRLFIATLLAATGALAMAQTPGQPAAGESFGRPAAGEQRGRMDPAQMQQRMAERRAQRMGQLKAQLNLTSAQEGAWNSYMAAMQPPAMGQRPHMNRGEMASLSTPQRIDRMQTMQVERQARMKQRGDATKAFYAQLTPEQQKVFDTQSMRHGRGGMHGKGPGHGQGQHRH